MCCTVCINGIRWLAEQKSCETFPCCVLFILVSSLIHFSLGQNKKIIYAYSSDTISHIVILPTITRYEVESHNYVFAFAGCFPGVCCHSCITFLLGRLLLTCHAMCANLCVRILFPTRTPDKTK